MGHLNDHDPANTRAITHSQLGMGCETQRFRTGHYSNPARGGRHGYTLWLRTKAVNLLDTQGSYCFAAHSAGCSISSVRRWERRILPFRIPGGRQRKSLTGADQLLLVICIFIFPEASLEEVVLFIHSNGGDIYTHPQIAERCIQLNLTRKISSKESYDAFYTAFIQVKHWFTPPLL